MWSEGLIRRIVSPCIPRSLRSQGTVSYPLNFSVTSEGSSLVQGSLYYIQHQVYKEEDEHGEKVFSLFSREATVSRAKTYPHRYRTTGKRKVRGARGSSQAQVTPED